MHWREAEDASGWHQHRAAVVTDIVAAYPPDGWVLDLGGGNGFVSRALVKAGIPAVVVDPVDAAVHAAYERGLRPVVCSSIDAAGFAPGSLPAVGMFDVLEHLDDDLGHLLLIRTLLVPGGRLYLTVPKHQWLWSSHDAEAGHQRRYNVRTLCDVVQRAGFVIEHQSSLFSVLLAPMLVRRMLPVGRGRANGSVVADPTAGDGLGARALRRALARERSQLRRHGRRVGTSIILVARAGRPGSPSAGQGRTSSAMHS
jgi:SAM-dependent methyltransferase